MIYFYIGLASIFLVFFTIYKKTNAGKNIFLGSFFIIKKYITYNYNVLSFKQLDLLLIRLLISILLLVLLYKPSFFNLNSPYVKDPILQVIKTEDPSNKIEFNTDNLVLDNYEADIFFINTFIKNYKTTKERVELVYSPTKDFSTKQDYTYIIFLSKEQDLDFFSKFKDYFYISNLETSITVIDGIRINNYYPVFLNQDLCLKKLENGNCLVLSIIHDSNKYLIFLSSLGPYWGDLGISAYFIDIIDLYLKGINFDLNIINTDDKSYASISSKLPKYNYLRIFLILMLLESLIFVLRKKVLLTFIFLFSSNLFSNSFKFIYLNYEDIDYSKFFKANKTYIEERTSVKFNNSYYQAVHISELRKDFLPDLPYLWIFGCSKTFSFNEDLISFFKNFVNKGGIIISDSCGVNNDFSYNYNIEQLVHRVIGSRNLDFLDYEKAILKSFFILDKAYLKGVIVSQTTMRIPLFISRNNLVKRVGFNDEEAKKIVLNVVLYMLSGNYKSDQVHAKHILERIKNKDLIR